MSDFSQGPGWWQASDDKWYPPEQAPAADPAPPPWGQAPVAAPWGAPGPGYGAPGYPQPGGYGPVAGYAPYGSGLPSVQGLGVASLVLGVLALMFFWCWVLGLPLAAVGLPLGLVALSRIKKGAADPGARGVALGGAICSGIALGIGLLVVLLFIST